MDNPLDHISPYEKEITAMTGEKVLRAVKAVREAYADNQRNLDWRHDEWLTLPEAVSAIRAIGQYNLFRPESVLVTLGYCVPKALIQPAREGSVALYLKCAEEEAQALKGELSADEFDYTDGVLRLWWD